MDIVPSLRAPGATRTYSPVASCYPGRYYRYASERPEGYVASHPSLEYKEGVRPVELELDANNQIECIILFYPEVADVSSPGISGCDSDNSKSRRLEELCD